MASKAYDVVVVGCGPGGATAGRFAALSGLKTLIVDKKRHIGFPWHDPACWLFSKSEAEDVIGLEIDPRCIDSKAEELVLFSPSGTRGKGQPLPDGIFVDRYLFDRFLATEAVRGGAEIMLNTRAVDLVKEKGVVRGVVVKNGAELTTIPCSVVIGADGLSSHTARMLNMSRPKVQSVSLGCHFVGAKPLQPAMRSIEFYLWEHAVGLPSCVCVRAEDIVSVGLSSPPKVIKGSISLREQLDRFMRHLEQVNDKLPTTLRSGY